MLQTTRTPDPSNPAVQPAARDMGRSQAFPAAAPDLAKASLPPFTARASAEQERGKILGAVLDELDGMTKNASGVAAVSEMLKTTGMDRKQVISAFINRDKSTSVSAIVRELTAVPLELVEVHTEKIRARGSGDSAEIAGEVLSSLVGEERIPLRDLVIEAVTGLMMSDGEDYESRRTAVSKQYEKIYTEMCQPKPMDVTLYALREAGRPVLNAAKSVGLFVLRSVVLHNLPGFIHEKFDFKSNECGESYYAACALSGAANAYLALSAISRLTGHGVSFFNSSDSAAVTVSKAVGVVFFAGFIEFLARGSLFRFYKQDTVPGWFLLEAACLPYYGGKEIAKSLGRVKASAEEKLREQRAERLKQAGL